VQTKILKLHIENTVETLKARKIGSDGWEVTIAGFGY
jgi:hypothetical protein